MNRFLVFLATCFAAAPVFFCAAEESVSLGWDAWVPLSGEWRLDNGEIVGRTAAEMGWLRTKSEFADFELSLEFQTPKPCNGGVQFRGHWLPMLPAQEGVKAEDLPRRMYGYQANIDTTHPEQTGAVMVEHGVEPLCYASPEAQKTLKANDWNLLFVRAVGPIIEVAVNGVPAARVYDERFLQGLVALQVQAVDQVPAEVRYRNVKIRDLGRTGEWTSLFNGKDLSGWKNWGSEEFSVEDGAIMGRSGPKKSEGYLCTEASWKDFRARGRFKMLGEGNFGLFYHASIALREDGFPVITGVQGEVEPSWPGSTGWHYESYRRGWIVKPDTQQLGAWALRPGEWNEIEIRAVGNRITTWVNGIQTVDFYDNRHQVFEGGLALQLHAGGVDGIAWKDLFVQDLSIRDK